MYKSFHVLNFRCFPELNIETLDRINLIAGVNNVGKTALLEALFLHCGAYNPALALTVNALRGIDTLKIERGRWVETPWDLLFHHFDSSQTVELKGNNTVTGYRWLRLKSLRSPSELNEFAQSVLYKLDDSQKTISSLETAQILELEYEEEGRRSKFYLIIGPGQSADMTALAPAFVPRIVPVPPPPPFPAFFQGARMRTPFREEAERYGKLEIENKHEVLLSVLKLIEPRLKRIAIVVVGGEPMLHGDIGLSRLVPLPAMGEGMVRLASLVIIIGNAPNGVVLIDEIENGLHHYILPKIWRAIGDVARLFNTQVFATTHSLECIVAAHGAFVERGVYDFRLHRLERIKETVHMTTYDQETLTAAIATGLEVR